MQGFVIDILCGFCILPVKMAPVVPTKTYTVQCKYWVTKDRFRIKSRMTMLRMTQGRKYINFASWVNNGIVVQSHWSLDLWRPSSFLPPVMMRRTSVILTARKQLKKGDPAFYLRLRWHTYRHWERGFHFQLRRQ